MMRTAAKRVRQASAAVAPLLLCCTSAAADEQDFVGTWLLQLDHRPAGLSYGTLDIELHDAGVAAFIDGGPVPVVIDGDTIVLDFGWANGGGIVFVSELSGTLSGGTITGAVALDGTPTGTWRATPRAQAPGLGEPPRPADFAGVWRMLTDDGTGKDRFHQGGQGRRRRDCAGGVKGSHSNPSAFRAESSKFVLPGAP